MHDLSGDAQSFCLLEIMNEMSGVQNLYLGDKKGQLGDGGGT